MQTPDISVIIPAYNCGHCLGRAVDSVLNQTTEFTVEVIIVDDGSTDNTRVVADELRCRYAGKIRCFSQPNAGPGAARNRGVREAYGQYVCFVDADDIIYPGSLDCRARFLRLHPEAHMVFGDYDYMASGKAIVRNILAQREVMKPLERHCRKYGDGTLLIEGDAYQWFFERNPFPVFTNTVMARRAGFPPFREDVFVGEDLACWWRLLREAPAGFINQAIAVYYHAPGSVTGNELRNHRDSARVYEAIRLEEEGKCRGVLRRLVAQEYFDIGYILCQEGSQQAALSALRQCVRHQWFHAKAYKVALVVILRWMKDAKRKSPTTQSKYDPDMTIQTNRAAQPGVDANRSASHKPVVIHAVDEWLPLTMTWIFNQIKLVRHYMPIVYTNEILDNSPFSRENVFTSLPDNILMRWLQRYHAAPKYYVFDQLVRRYAPALVHSHFGPQGWNMLSLVRKHRLKHVVTFYGFDVDMLPSQTPEWQERYQELFGEAHLFLCEGPHMASCLIRRGCPREKIKIQRLGADVERIPFAPRRVGDDGIIKILIAGTFREKKGLPYAVEAVGILKNDGYPNITMTIIGDATKECRDQVEKEKIIDAIHKYKMQTSVRMLGFQSHSILLREALSHHIFLSPSVTASDGDTEGGSPVTITELAASGMPVVATRHCDIPEVVKEGVTGYLAEERDVEGLVQALKKCIDNRASWEQIGHNARRHIAEEFNLTTLVVELQNKYDLLVS